MSQPPYYPAPGGPPQPGAYQPPPHPGAYQPPPHPGPPVGAAPTQLGFPGQVQFAPQPQYAPTPQQAAGAQSATAVGFPGYRSPPPSKKNRTSAVIGSLVVLLTVGLAVLGFWLVS